MKTVNDILDNYKESVLKLDLDQFMSMYDASIHIFDTWTNWEMRGIDNWRKVVEDWFAMLRRDRSTLRVSYEDLVVVESDELAYIHTGIRFSEFNPNNIEFRHLTNRFTLVLKKIGDEWKIIHEHSSLPINPDKGNGMFDIK